MQSRVVSVVDTFGFKPLVNHIRVHVNVNQDPRICLFGPNEKHIDDSLKDKVSLERM